MAESPKLSFEHSLFIDFEPLVAVSSTWNALADVHKHPVHILRSVLPCPLEAVLLRLSDRVSGDAKAVTRFSEESAKETQTCS